MWCSAFGVGFLNWFGLSYQENSTCKKWWKDPFETIIMQFDWDVDRGNYFRYSFWRFFANIAHLVGQVYSILSVFVNIHWSDFRHASYFCVHFQYVIYGLFVKKNPFSIIGSQYDACLFSQFGHQSLGPPPFRVTLEGKLEKKCRMFAPQACGRFLWFHFVLRFTFRAVLWKNFTCLCDGFNWF